MESQKSLSVVKDQLNFIKEKVLPTLWRMIEAEPDNVALTNFPLNLGTIRSRLNFNVYKNPRECLGDFQRMFSSAFIYFPPSSPAFNQAKSLEAEFKRLMRDMPKDEANERTIPTTSTSPKADLPVPVEPAPILFSKTNLEHSLEESRQEILAWKTEEPSSVTQSEGVFKIPLKPAPKRKRVERCADPVPALPRTDSTALPSSNLGANVASSPSSSAGSSSKSDLLMFKKRYHNKQLEFINRQLVNLGDQLRLVNKNRKEGRYTGMEALLDRQSRLCQAQKEWFNVRNLEEYEDKKDKGQ
ncbi:unnamed protein product [Orchesella dallaii]|uniref:Bromo domain-containing protein n=1 Tax=Orchesella dallaii TaxID=48710 RepID=A0ABP1R4H2_9HEXA